MDNGADSGLRLEGSGLEAPLLDPEAINRRLVSFGIRVWPLDLGGIGARLRGLIEREHPNEAELAEIKAAFLLERERLLALVREARGQEAVPGGGALETRVVNHGQDYPQLHLAVAGRDYSRFDRYHVNTDEAGTPVDEVLQLLSGGGFRVFHRNAAREEVLLALSCPARDLGWTLTYSGGAWHIGSMTRTRPGTKLLVQAFGPPRWTMRYAEEEREA